MIVFSMHCWWAGFHALDLQIGCIQSQQVVAPSLEQSSRSGIELSGHEIGILSRLYSTPEANRQTGYFYIAAIFLSAGSSFAHSGLCTMGQSEILNEC
jgi:hypothetical protein